jgi:hypothetical protein
LEESFRVEVVRGAAAAAAVAGASVGAEAELLLAEAEAEGVVAVRRPLLRNLSQMYFRFATSQGCRTKARQLWLWAYPRLA